jgi:SAM-dependent methyltransferase
LCDLNRPIPLPDASFDTILFSDVLEHLYRPREAVAEIARLLRPGGKLLLNVPFFYWLHEAPHDYFRYTCFALERLASDAGLTPLVLEPLGGAPEVLADLVGKLAARVRFIGPPFASLTQATCYRLVGTRLGRRVSQATARQFPLGYFMVAQAP